MVRGCWDNGYEREGDGDADGELRAALTDDAGEGSDPPGVRVPSSGHTVTAAATAPPARTTPAPTSNPFDVIAVFLRGALRRPRFTTRPRVPIPIPISIHDISRTSRPHLPPLSPLFSGLFRAPRRTYDVPPSHPSTTGSETLPFG